jgi:hypothetical protein
MSMFRRAVSVERHAYCSKQAWDVQLRSNFNKHLEHSDFNPPEKTTEKGYEEK